MRDTYGNEDDYCRVEDQFAAELDHNECQEAIRTDYES